MAGDGKGDTELCGVDGKGIVAGDCEEEELMPGVFLLKRSENAHDGERDTDIATASNVEDEEAYEEEELMPGVYLMKPSGHAPSDNERTAVLRDTGEVERDSTSSGPLGGCEGSGEEVKTMEDLEREVARAANACLKLIESQEAIREAMATDTDPVYEEALAENREVIARLQAEVLQAKEEMFAKFRVTPHLDARVLASEVVEEAGVFL